MYLLLVDVLGITSQCQILRNLERSTNCHDDTINRAVGNKVRRASYESLLRYLLRLVDLAQQLYDAIREWTSQYSSCTARLDKLDDAAQNGNRLKVHQRLAGATKWRRFCRG